MLNVEGKFCRLTDGISKKKREKSAQHRHSSFSDA